MADTIESPDPTPRYEYKLPVYDLTFVEEMSTTINISVYDLEELEKEIKNLRAYAESLDSENDNQAIEIEELREENRKLKLENAKLIGERDGLQMVVERLHKEIEEQDKEIQELKKKLEEYQMENIKGEYATAIMHCKSIEDEAIKQIEDICNNQVMEGCNIAIMPDAHAGAGCVIGFTSNINDKIIPNLVGVDIGCGMAYAKFKADEIDFEALDKYIRENIPSGFEINDKFQLLDKEGLHLDKLVCKEHIDRERAELSIGTLGGGNHFIEIDKDDKGYYYLVIHSGSRYLGKQVCEYYQNLAYEKCKSDVKVEGKTRTEMIDFLKSEGRQREIQSYKEIYHKAQDNSIDKDTAYLRGEDKDNYINDALICKDYAKLNRMCMALKILQFLGVESEYLRETVHNYIDKDGIIRKGAIRNEGENLIPINMRDGAFIVESKGDNGKERNNSLPHGAGRLMSRGKARATISVEDFKKSMEGIYSSCVSEATLDESPMAYKSIDNIQDVIGDVCVIKEHIKPVYNFKAS